MTIRGLNGGIVGKDNAAARYSYSGVVSMFDHYSARLGNRWPTTQPFAEWAPTNLQTGGNWTAFAAQLAASIAASSTAGEGVTTPTGTYAGGGAFQGGVLLSDGRVFCAYHHRGEAPKSFLRGVWFGQDDFSEPPPLAGDRRYY